MADYGNLAQRNHILKGPDARTDLNPMEDIDNERLRQLEDMEKDGLLTEEELQELNELRPPVGNADLKHDANLAEVIDDSELARIADDVIRFFEEDEESRWEWRDRERLGIRLLGVSERVRGEAGYFKSRDDVERREEELEEELPFDGASRVTHTMLIEAALQFSSRAMAELWPAEGPAKTMVMGPPSQELEAQAKRVRQFLNYQYNHLMPAGYEEMDALLFRLALSGSCFKKCYHDDLANTVVAMFVHPQDFVTSYSTTDLTTANRYTQVLRISQNDMRKLQYDGLYREVPLIEPNEETATQRQLQDEIDATTNTYRLNYDEDERHTALEMHIDWDMPGFEHRDEYGNPTGIMLPYIITVSKDSRQVLAIRRNWRKRDDTFRKRIYFIHYRLSPGFGFYGFGFLHLIGHLARASTGSLRSLLDAAQFSNWNGGFVDDTIALPESGVVLRPGAWIPINAVQGELERMFYTPPYAEPSQTMFNLMGYLDDMARRVTGTTELAIGDSDPRAPVGTTLALMEASTRVPNSIHRRLHRSLGQELQLVAELNRDFLPPVYPYQVQGADQFVMAQDFDERIDVIPVSNPELMTMSQRIAQSQAEFELAQSAPELYDLYEVHKRMLVAIRAEDIDKILPPPNQKIRLDPVTENASLWQGQPIKAFPEQEHQAHIMVHQDLLMRLGQDESQQTIAAALQAHITEHMALQYLLEMQQQTGLPFTQNWLTIEEAEQTGSQNERQQQLASALGNEAAIIAAQAIQQAQQQAQGEQPPSEEELAAQAESQAMQAEAMKAQAETEKLQAQTRQIEASQDKLEAETEKIEIETLQLGVRPTT